jgi:hypothetical protein
LELTSNIKPMKSTVKKYIVVASTFLALMTIGCNDVLDEQPRSVLVPEFFTTAQGLNAGVTAAYASFRYYYANEGGMNLSVYGTDEFTHGQQVTNPPLNVYSATLNPDGGGTGGVWQRAYIAINTCNGIIDLGQQATDLTEAQRNALIAEAKFIRANWYFILVQTFGGVTLDLGSGPLKFNTSTDNKASRATLAECYDAIVQDLIDITDGLDSDDLPTAKPTTTPGRVWRASALHLLSKVYLTRGYTTAAVAGDFQKAYDTAMDLINNAATYNVALLPNYSSVHQQGNENNSETLFQVNWIDNTTFNNNQAFGGPAYQNVSLFLFRCFYHQNIPGMIRDIPNGRLFVRYKPTAWLLNTAFSDKINDSRFNKSFQSVWYVNSTTTLNPKALPLGDTAMWIVPAHLAASVAPTIDTRRYVVFLPDAATNPGTYFGPSGAGYPDFAGYSNGQNKYYPSLSKYNSTQPRPGNDVNIASVRPFIVYRFAETYLIAAEAALQLGLPMTDVANLINVVRDRAGDSPAAKAALTGTTLADVTANGIDYILDERAREHCGEQMRWFDLVRTGRLIARVNAFNGVAARPGATVPNPLPFHLLRPIPTAQIDGSVDPTTADGKYPQNPGY